LSTFKKLVEHVRLFAYTEIKRATLRFTITRCVKVQSCNGRNHAEWFGTLP